MDDRCVRCGFPTDECDCHPIGVRPNPINPWAAKLPIDIGTRPEWEFVPVTKTAEKHPDLYRIRVHGGWLYRLAKSDTLTFVPG